MSALPVLRTLTNENLLASVLRLASEERRITLSVLEHFREIERRKAYADLGYRSLFDYAVKHLRYSEPSASRRIAAMYALKAHPELAAPLSSGEATVTNVAKIETTLRREERASGEKMDAEEKKKAFREMSGLPARELERKLVEMAPRSALVEKVRPVTPELRELRIFLSEEVFAELEDLMALRGRSLANPGSYSELFGELIRAAKRAHLEKFSEKPRRKASPLAGKLRRSRTEVRVEFLLRIKHRHGIRLRNRIKPRHEPKPRLRIEHRPEIEPSPPPFAERCFAAQGFVVSSSGGRDSFAALADSSRSSIARRSPGAARTSSRISNCFVAIIISYEGSGPSGRTG